MTSGGSAWDPSGWVISGPSNWKLFGKELLITQSYGKKLEYLAMTLDYSTPGKVQVSMTHYIKLILQDVPGDMHGTAATPAGKCLFTINAKPVLLENKKKGGSLFTLLCNYYIWAKYPGQIIARPFSFLCGRLQEADKSDQILERDSGSTNEIAWWQYRKDQMVGGCIVCCLTRYERAYRWYTVAGKRISVQQLIKAEAGCPQLNGKWGDWSAWCTSPGYLDGAFSKKTRGEDWWDGVLSEQHEFNVVGEKWAQF